jgi:hypothetical protein
MPQHTSFVTMTPVEAEGLFPELAHDLKAEPMPGIGPIRWPDKLALKLARTHPNVPDDGVISSGVWAMRVLQERLVHWTFGDIVWPPLTPSGDRRR